MVSAHRPRALVLAAALCASAAIGLASAANAGTIPVTSYDMNNGNGLLVEGWNNYWDATYNGSGAVTTDGAALSGGTGALSNGVIATQNYSMVSNSSGTGEYVGWKYTDPTITFHLASGFLVQQLSIYVGISHGVYGGLVGAPGEVSLSINGGPSQTYSWVSSLVPGSTNAEVFTINFDAPVSSSDSFALTLYRGALLPDSYQYASDYPGDTEFMTKSFAVNKEAWLMVSEVTFATAAVPEPSTWIMMIAGFAGLGLFGWRRRRQALRAA